MSWYGGKLVIFSERIYPAMLRSGITPNLYSHNAGVGFPVVSRITGEWNIKCQAMVDGLAQVL